MLGPTPRQQQILAFKKKGLIARGIGHCAIRVIDVDSVLAFGGTIG